ncbi:MAG TPA: DUF47 family protein [Actinomycetota bacterium]|nr:DUF47 family protein [Actinomycetota bacterium]
MKLRFIPQDRVFFDLFDRSAQNAAEGARLYKAMLDGFDDPKGSARLILDAEHAGDEITHEIIRRLNTTFVTPIDREDIHALATAMDDVMDFIEAAADNFVLHKVEAPTPESREQAEVLVRICAAVAEGVTGLRRFKDLEQHLIAIKSIEAEGDKIYRRAVAELFSGNHKALEVLKWKEIYDEVEAAIDAAEDVANYIEAIQLKHA